MHSPPSRTQPESVSDREASPRTESVSRVRAIDGLRAVAVGLVLAHHLDVPRSGGGWLGVDLFFVISGFVITRTLLAERARRGEISLRNFYVRRAARLYPALVLALVLWIASPGAWTGGGMVTETVVVVLTYTQPLLQLGGLPEAGLGHTWSLAVEEAFYLLWAPVMALVIRSRRTLMLTGCALALASLVACILWPPGDRPGPPAAYSLPPTRAWELLAGALLAAAPAIRWPRQTPLSGVALLAVAVLLGSSVDRTALTFVLEALLACTGSVLLIAGVVAAPRGAIATLLAAPVLVFVGDISYGVYLLHPILIHDVQLVLGPSSRWLVWAPLSVCATVAVAFASYRWLEQPIRHWAAGRV